MARELACRLHGAFRRLGHGGPPGGLPGMPPWAELPAWTRWMLTALCREALAAPPPPAPSVAWFEQARADAQAVIDGWLDSAPTWHGDEFEQLGNRIAEALARRDARIARLTTLIYPEET